MQLNQLPPDVVAIILRVHAQMVEEPEHSPALSDPSQKLQSHESTNGEAKGGNSQQSKG